MGNDEMSEEEGSMSFYLRPPADSRSIHKRVSEFHLPSRGSLKQFLRFFSGLRESEPGVSGDFPGVLAWQTFEESLGEYTTACPDQEIDPWRKSVVIFNARNGNRVLMRQDGRLAWDVKQEQRVDERWTNFDEFIAHYADYLEYDWPFDSYGPSDKAIQWRLRKGINDDMNRRPKL